MAKIDLLSKEWCELIFQGRNHAYGAYDMRKKSFKRHMIAICGVVILTIVVIGLPLLIKTIATPNEREIEADVTALSDIKMPPKKEEPKQQYIPPKEELPPPPKVKAAMKFTPPVIKKDEDVKKDNELKDQEKLKESKASISTQDIKGSTDRDAVNFEDIKKDVVTTPPPAKPDPVVQKPFDYVEQMPEFPGGDDALQKYLASHLQYPANAADMGIQGKVVVRFVVQADGSVAKVSVVKKLDPECDREAIRVIQSLPKFIPGRQNGNAVPVWNTLVVTFRLQ